MSTKPATDLTAPPSKRSKLALPLLILILAFFGYGFFERTRLIAAQEREKEATKVIMETIKGNTMSSEAKDWRVMFVPDQPDTAVRVGTIYFPHEGAGPNYTQKVVDLLRTCEKCELVFITEGPFVRKGGGGMFGGAPPKEEKPQEKKEMELLDIEVIRKEFPNLQIQNADIIEKAKDSKTDSSEKSKEGSKTDAEPSKDSDKAESNAKEEPKTDAAKETPAAAEPSKTEPAKTEPSKEEPKQAGAEPNENKNP